MRILILATLCVSLFAVACGDGESRRASKPLPTWDTSPPELMCNDPNEEPEVAFIDDDGTEWVSCESGVYITHLP